MSENPSHYTDTLQQARAMVDALQVARESIALDRIGLASCCTQPDGHVDAEDAPALAAYDSLLEQIDAAMAPVTGSPAPLCELIRWHLVSDVERPDAEITVDLQILTPEGDSAEIERGWWDGESWLLCESGGKAVQSRVRAWAEVWGPEL